MPSPGWSKWAASSSRFVEVIARIAEQTHKRVQCMPTTAPAHPRERQMWKEMAELKKQQQEDEATNIYISVYMDGERGRRRTKAKTRRAN